MREIKFRVWNGKTMGEMDLYADGDFLNSDDVVLQYTEFKDKKSIRQKIYHKDILEVGDDYCGDHFEKGGNFIVEWIEGGWVAVDSNGEFLCELYEAVSNRNAKVIGNIYENPELLEQAK